MRHHLFTNNRHATLLNAGDRHVVGASSDRYRHAFERGAVLIKRQSSAAQPRDHLGSAPAQEDARHWVSTYGFDPEQVRIVDALGESGQEWADRKVFKAELERARAGQIGILILPLHNRAGRNDRDTTEMIDAIKLHHGFILAERRMFDPNDHNDYMMLKFYATIAEHQVAAHTKWMMETKLELAKVCALQIPLPAGLTWAKLDEPYLQALTTAVQTAGHPEWLELALHHQERWQSRVIGEDGMYFPLWFPDADVIRSVDMRLDRFMQTGSVGDVMRMIELDAAYPRPGLVPQTPRQMWVPGQQAEWLPARHTSMRFWLTRPALYGIYSYTTGRSRKLSATERWAIKPTIFEHEVFPAFLSSEDHARAEKLLANPPRRRIKNITMVSGHLLPIVRCGHPISEDRVCGRKLYPTTVKGVRGGLRYQSPGCVENHGDSVGIGAQLLESVVLEVVSSALRPELIMPALGRLQLDGSAAAEQVQRLRREIAEVESDIQAAGMSEDKHRSSGDHRAAERAHQRQTKHETRLEELRGQLRTTETDAGRLRALGKADVADVMRLAHAVDELFACGRHAPHAIRNLLELCVDGIYMRTIDKSAWEVDIAFPSGVTVRRTIRSRALNVEQPQLAWAHAWLAHGVAAGDIAAELNEILGVRTRRIPFTARRVESAAAEYDRQPAPDSGDAPLRTLAQLSAQLGATEEEVLDIALRGLLGAAVSRNGEFLLAPEEALLHRHFPSYARRQAALAAPGEPWPEHDTMTVAELSLRVGVRKESVERRARLLSAGVVMDLAGRRYMRESVVAADLRDRIAAAVAARGEGDDADPTHWMVQREALARTKVGIDRLLAAAPSLELPAVGKVRKETLVWVGPPVLDALSTASLRDAVADLAAARRGRGLAVEDFHPRAEVVARFAKVLGQFASHVLDQRRMLRPEIFVEVDALAVRDGRLMTVRHMYVPPEVWRTDSANLLRKWLYGPSRQDRYEAEQDPTNAALGRIKRAS